MNSTAEFRQDDKQEHREGPVARTIEQQTAKIPSDAFLWAAFGSIGAAAFCELTGRKQLALFVGQWVAPFLLLGVYNKIVKVAGSDKREQSGLSNLSEPMGALGR